MTDEKKKVLGKFFIGERPSDTLEDLKESVKLTNPEVKNLQEPVTWEDFAANIDAIAQDYIQLRDDLHDLALLVDEFCDALVIMESNVKRIKKILNLDQEETNESPKANN